MILKRLRLVAWVLAWIVAMFCALWSLGALYFDFPWPSLRGATAAMLGAGYLAAVIFLRGRWRKFGAVIGGFVVVLVWWFTLKPSNDRSWQPDVAQLPWAEINGDEVTLHNVRNCDYRTETEFTTKWETRTVNLSKLTGVDIAICYWGSPWMAHPIASFQFSDARPVCFSIETRKELGESYSAIGGIYRQYELMYIVADERDVIRVRTNFRKGEDVYLYHTAATAEAARGRFLEYLATLNTLRSTPRWYNAVTTNCTTAIRTQHSAAKRAPWDWRMLANGKGDEMMFERKAIISEGLPFAELKVRSKINPAAQAANDAPDFSKRIREGLPSL